MKATTSLKSRSIGETALLPKKGLKEGSLTGFTIVELLTTLGILLLIGSMFVISPDRGPRSYELSNAIGRLESELRKVQGFAIATRNFNAAPPPGGWGIHFVTGQPYYTIFGDQGTVAGTSGRFDAAEEYERIYLPSTVDLLSLSVDGVTESDGMLDIVYRPPQLQVRFDNDTTKTEAIISLHDPDINLTRTVKANRVGNVEIP